MSSVFHEAVDWALLTRVVVALGLGGLIGLERERHHREKNVMAGVRTMPLVSLSGMLLVFLADAAGEPMLIVAGLLVFGALAVFMARGKERESEGTAGLTTPVAFVATFLVGLLVGHDEFLLATIAGVAMTLILFYKERLHRLADVLSEDEMRSAMYFTVIAFILYPLAPDRAIGPDGIINLRQALLIAVLVSVLSFLGFLAMRRWGPSRGIPSMGFLGGLASSVAAAAAIAALPLRSPPMRHAAVMGILAAAAAMLVRNLVIAALVVPGLDLALWLAVPFGFVGLVLGAGFLAQTRRAPAAGEDEEHFDPRQAGIKSPFAVGPALKFALLFLVLTVAAHYLGQLPGLGDEAVYLTAAGGLVTTGAVVASMGVLVAAGQLDLATAVSVCLVAAALSLATKAFISRGAGADVARPTMVVLALGAAVALAGAVAVRFLPM